LSNIACPLLASAADNGHAIDTSAPKTATANSAFIIAFSLQSGRFETLMKANRLDATLKSLLVGPPRLLDVILGCQSRGF